MINIKDIRRYYKLFKMSQDEIANYISKRFKGSVYQKNGFVYVPGEDSSKICLVSHLDTVHSQLPKEILSSKVNGMTKIFSPSVGIGADDRCGVISNLSLYDELNSKPHLLFTFDEELGGIGIREYVETDLAKKINEKINCYIEFDRKGESDYIDHGEGITTYYGHSKELLNKFSNAIQIYLESKGVVADYKYCNNLLNKKKISSIMNLQNSISIPSSNLVGYIDTMHFPHYKGSCIHYNYKSFQTSIFDESYDMVNDIENRINANYDELLKKCFMSIENHYNKTISPVCEFEMKDFFLDEEFFNKINDIDLKSEIELELLMEFEV